ncbi:uncharacterized protein DSM5745_08522 [Aspergillus mulundensis]|uniref:Uncharacterized protein n=1 Tax=Aspergillus mulundensis TaxID=1810919 RepID=A0A3D8R3X6_9EURO|nr:hypothetical protein DSM5745_08522 [Aspergillus mulundensis]RDW68762.1 hypothetical protein DSM5745_08522 [Aspergillus mulundensis]
MPEHKKISITPYGPLGPKVTQSGKTTTIETPARLYPRAEFQPFSTPARADATRAACPCLTRTVPAPPDLTADRPAPKLDWNRVNANVNGDIERRLHPRPTVAWASTYNISVGAVHCPVHVQGKQDPQWVLVVHPFDTNEPCAWLFLGQASVRWLGMEVYRAKTGLFDCREARGCGHEECELLYQKRYLATLSGEEMQFIEKLVFEKWYRVRDHGVTSLAFITEVVAQCTRERAMFGEDVRDIIMELVKRFGRAFDG